MRICGRQNLLLALAPFVLAACGGGEESGSAGGASSNNLPPIIQGTPVTTLSAGATYTFTPTAADPDGDALSFSASNVPAWAAFDAATGKLSGTPTEAHVGMSESIVIEVTDAKAVAQLPAFRIQVASNSTVAPPNSAPSISGQPATSATVGRLYTFAPVGDDVDDDELSYTIENKPSWLTFTPATGELRGTPAANNVGTVTDIVITVSDGNETTSLAPFDLQVVATAPANRAPTITGTPNATVTVGATYSFRPVGSDADGDSLTYSIQNKPSWAQFSASTGRLWGPPTAANVGTSARITISVSDGTAPPVSLPSFTIAVSAQANRAPTISGSPSLSIAVGAAYSFQPTASDPDGNVLSFSVTNLPSWATFNTTTGRISGTPASGAIGVSLPIVITVSDGRAFASLPSFIVAIVATGSGTATVNWTPPTANTDGSTLTNLAGFRVAYGRSATTLTQSITLTNPGLASHTVTGLTSGQWFFAVRARNSAGAESDISNVASKTIP